jgi:hypothetical protein
VLVYGDRSESADPAERLNAIGEQIDRIRLMPPGLDRHSALVRALIEAGQLLQSVADAEGETNALTRLVQRIAECVLRSWDRDFAEIGELPSVPDVKALPDPIELRTPEGFAFYAVYPEAFAHAARKLRLSAPPRVIGIRSIGTSLGAIVAAALDAPLVTVRPFGDPFARQVDLPADLIDDNSHYVIVDEGPGQSGSSFGSVADWLDERGVPLERIAFVPSHAGNLGPVANETHRRRWHRAQRVPADFNPSWLAHRFGPLETLRSGERLKFLGWSGAERVLLKFAGLGAIGERKLEMARALHSAGWTPKPLGLVHGFLVERWCEQGRPLAPGDRPVEEIGRYIGARARLFPAGRTSGASIETLLEMCRRNISLALGDEAARALELWDTAGLSSRVTRVRTDNKLDRDKWLRLPDGRLLKTDALDHHQAHDLIGCQDIAWDVAGAIAEFDLEPSETNRLIAATGHSVNRVLLDFYCTAYLAFRLGQATLAADGHAGRYAARLRQLLHHCPATRLESLIG